MGCSRQTASKWVNRGRRGEGLADRSSRPRRSPRRTPAAVEEAILRAREQLREGPHVIGWAVGRCGLDGARRLASPRPLAARAPARRGGDPLRALPARRADPCRHQEAGRIVSRATGSPATVAAAKGKAGWQHLFVAIDDHTRLGFAAVYPDETADSAIAFLTELVRFYTAHGIHVERVLTDNGSCFKRRWADACNDHQIAVKKTRAYRPQTNGKAERFIRTMLERWAYAYTYDNESARLAALAPALDFYNRFRPHRALKGLTPLQRVNNLPGTNNCVPGVRNG